MSGCLGDVAAALVDGELDHAARERAHRHLAHCGPCRAEVDAQRRLKARLSGIEHREPPAALTDRLMHLTLPADEPGPEATRRPSRPAAVPQAPSRATSRPLSRPPGSHPGAPRPPAVRGRAAIQRRAATGSAFALLGVAAALALGAPPPRPATTPVDPASEAFVTEFVSTTSDGAPAPVARTAGLTTFQPLTRPALLSTGSARTR